MIDFYDAFDIILISYHAPALNVRRLVDQAPSTIVHTDHHIRLYRNYMLSMLHWHLLKTTWSATNITSMYQCCTS